MTTDDWRMLYELHVLEEQVVLFGAAYVRERLREARAAQQEERTP